MALLATDIKHRLSTVAGAAGNTNVQLTPASSLGKYISTTDLVDATVQNLFPNVPAADVATGRIYYLCLFAYNSGALNYQNVVAWLNSQTIGGGDIAIGIDPTAASAVGAAPAQAVQIADIYTAPAGVVFTNPTTRPDALSIGTLTPGQCRAFWLRLSVAIDTPAINLDNAIYSVYGITEP
jgi:hypothetical protein